MLDMADQKFFRWQEVRSVPSLHGRLAGATAGDLSGDHSDALMAQDAVTGERSGCSWSGP